MQPWRALIHNRHLKTAPPDAVYIGRGTPWGNPYYDGGRDYNCEQFELHTLPALDVEPLRGKHLVCSCYPKRCHGDSILRKLYGEYFE